MIISASVALKRGDFDKQFERETEVVASKLENSSSVVVHVCCLCRVGHHQLTFFIGAHLQGRGVRTTSASTLYLVLRQYLYTYRGHVNHKTIKVGLNWRIYISDFKSTNQIKFNMWHKGNFHVFSRWRSVNLFKPV